MFVILGILSVLIAIALIFIVVIQNSKGGGLSSSFGGTSGATQMFGARRSNEAIEKITWYLAGGLAIIAFVANVAGTSLTDEASLRMESAFDGYQYNAAPTDLVSPEQLAQPTEVPAPSPQPDGGSE